MSSAASTGKAAQSVATGGRVDSGSVDKPGAKTAGKAKPKMTAEQQKHYIVVGIAVAVVAGVLGIIFSYFYKPAPDPIRLNDPPQKIIAFITTNEFDKLEFDRKKLLWSQLSGKKKEVEEMHKAGQLNDAQLKEILSVMWIGKRFKHIEHYLSLGDLDRKDYLDKLIDETIAEPPKPKGTITKDDKRIKDLEQAFPAKERQDLEQFKQAMKDREKQRKAEDRAIKRNAGAVHTTSRPASRPADKPAGAASGAHPAVVPPK